MSKNTRIGKLCMIYRLCGYKEKDISELLGISPEKGHWTVQNHRHYSKKQGHLRAWVMKNKLDDVLADLVVENCKAMISIVKTAQNEDWCKEQNASALGTLYDKISDFSVQVLEAAGAAERDRDSTEEHGED